MKNNPLLRWITPDEQRILFFVLFLLFTGIILKISGNKIINEKAEKEIADSVFAEPYKIILDIRTADKKALLCLPGISEKKADKILEFRKNYGFQKTSDLMKVKGIGPLTYKKLSDCFLKFGEEDYEIKASVNYRKSVEKLNIKININTAGADELTLLEGIGLEKAKRIEEFRKTSGKFTAKEDIMKVKGIGKRTYEKIKDKIILKD